jgi:hypothetical protein
MVEGALQEILVPPRHLDDANREVVLSLPMKDIEFHENT